jgi:Spy/CpxP family protein refolding chaperone
MAMSIACFSSAWGDEQQHCHIDWDHLNLTPEQSQQIHELDNQWNKDYIELKPSIVDDQHRLTRLLSDHNSDPVEIMALQQSIARKKENLNGIATANYLKKRQLLNENQQCALEAMIRQAIVARQRSATATQTDAMPDRVQDLMEKVRHIWPIQNDH